MVEEEDGLYSKRHLSQALKLGKITVLCGRMKRKYAFSVPATVCLFIKQLTVRCETARRERLQTRRRSVARRLALVTRVVSPVEPNSVWSLSGRIELAIQQHGALGIAGASNVMQGGIAFATRSRRSKSNVNPARALESRLQELEQDLSSQLSD